MFIYIKKLLSDIQIFPFDYAKQFIKKGFFMKLIRRVFLKLSTWISPKLSLIHMPFSRKQIIGKDFHDCQFLLETGHIILSRTDGELANMFIPGFWSHVGMVTSNGTIIEAVTHGVQEVDLYTFFLDKDYICLLDCNYLTSVEKNLASEWAIQQTGKPYDFGMVLSGMKSFFCSELVYFAQKFANPNIPFMPRPALGMDTITPNDFWAAQKFYSIIWQSEASKSAM